MISQAAFELLVAEDLAWLQKQPPSAERAHVMALLSDAVLFHRLKLEVKKNPCGPLCPCTSIVSALTERPSYRPEWPTEAPTEPGTPSRLKRRRRRPTGG